MSSAHCFVQKVWGSLSAHRRSTPAAALVPLSAGLLLVALAGCTALELKPPSPSNGAQLAASPEAPAPSPAQIKAIGLSNQGVQKLQKQDFKGALKDFSQLIRLQPKMLDAYLGRGLAYAGLNNPQAAIADYNRALKLEPKFAAAYLNRADEYLSLGNKKQAIADLKTAAKLFRQQGETASAEQVLAQLTPLTKAGTAPKITIRALPAPIEPVPVAEANLAPEVALARHLSRIGAKMYGTYWCPYCTRQKELFRDGANQLTVIECDRGGANAQPQLCDQANVSSYPTWEINGQLYRGMRSLEELAQLSGFAGGQNFAN